MSDKKKASRNPGGLLFFLLESNSYGTRTPQLAPGYVGAAVGFESQYILVVKSSAPCRATAASMFAEFTEASRIEY